MTPAPAGPEPALEPLALWVGAERERAGARERPFEYASGGDRVPGRLRLPPEGAGPFPLVLAQHGAGGSKDAPYMDSVCAPWARSGAAVASIDFPLHGERANAKLGARLLRAAETPRERATPIDVALWSDFVRQSARDLGRALDALAGRPEVDPARIAYAGFSLGAVLGAPFCAGEPRVRAAALALGGGGIGPIAWDPLGHVARLAPRPVLFVNAERDARIPRASAEALHEAAAEPKEVLWFDCEHGTLPGSALRAIWRFVARELEIPERAGGGAAPPAALC